MLTDTAIRKATPTATARKLTDGAGMYLLLKPDGGRYWRMNYRHSGKQKTLALGVYPTVTLADARQRRDGFPVRLPASVVLLFLHDSSTFADVRYNLQRMKKGP